MIVGYEQSTSARGGIGSLLLAGRRGLDWIYVGSVRTGFSAGGCWVSGKEDPRRVEDEAPVVAVKGNRFVFVQPALIAEIEFRGWTDDGNLRHASYKGLREVQDNAAVFDMTGFIRS